MSPASQSKSSDKKACKEQKVHSKSNAGSGVLISGYNPLFGKFHTLETSPPSFVSPLHINSRFQSIDEKDDQCGISIGAGTEYDTISSNSSWSGDSEDPKDKPSPHPPLQADNDKREKIRQKNEKKHQRQKERRAQELHERCSGFLMSRKLDALSQQLVAMGFSSERATMALILNEGKIEESVSWLFEAGEDSVKHQEHNLNVGNLKIDISEELARIADIEIRHKCSKQDVERALVACEGDLEKAEETLRDNHNSLRAQPKSSDATTVQQQRCDNAFKYTKAAVTMGIPVESEGEYVQNSRPVSLKLDLAKPQENTIPTVKRWSNAALSLQRTIPQAKTETQYVALEREFNNHELGLVMRNPFVLMQRPQSDNPKSAPATGGSSSHPVPTSCWYANNDELVNPKGNVASIGIGTFVANNLSSKHMYDDVRHHQHGQFGFNAGTFYQTGNSPTLSVASSLGLFSGSGSTSGPSGPSSPVDWNSDGSLLMQLDYANVDWTLNPSPSRDSRLKSTGMWPGIASVMQNSTGVYNSFSSGSTTRNGGGLREGSSARSSGGLQEWSSPFEERDIFSLPRQFVSSPSL